MNRKKLGILISGRGSNMEALLKAAQDADWPCEPVLVLANKVDAGGLEKARSFGVQAVAIDHKLYGKDREAFERAMDAELKAAGVELIALAGFMRVLTPWFVNAWAGRLINIHPALLPKYPGVDTHNRALAAGDAVHGCTVHQVTAGVDEGPVIGSAEVDVLPGDTEATLASDIGIEADITMYPSELETRVGRLMTAQGGAPGGTGGSGGGTGGGGGSGGTGRTLTSLVRHGGMATTSDRLLSLAVNWRVRLDNADGSLSLPLPSEPSPTPPAPTSGAQPLVDVAPPGKPGVLPCSQVPAQSPQIFRDLCQNLGSTLVDMPAGVPPLYGRLASWGGGAYSFVGTKFFPVEAGGPHVTSVFVPGPLNLPRANYYFQAVGYPVAGRTTSGAAFDPLAPLPPPDFGTGPPNSPQVPLKAVYKSLEPGAVRLDRYDITRQQEFRVVQLANTAWSAQNTQPHPPGTLVVLPDGGVRYERDVGGPDGAVLPGDLAYLFFTNLLQPPTPTQGAPLSGSPASAAQHFVIRIGSDEGGVECDVTFDASTGALRGTCDGRPVEEVLGALDLVYLELYLAGNADNVLARLEIKGRDKFSAGVTPARIILPVRNHTSTAVTSAGALVADSSLDPPIHEPAVLNVFSSFPGVLTVHDGLTLIAQCDIVGGNLGVSSFTPVSGLVPTINHRTGALAFILAPRSVGTYPLRVQLIPPAALGLGTLTKMVDLDTVIDDLGALPVGHVFVKDVSVVDGHLVKQGEDLRVPGRGPPLAFSHTYTNRGFDEGSLGKGWSHSFQSEVFVVPEPLVLRATVIGGEGTGQAFKCGVGFSACAPQVGYHGTLKPLADGLVYRARGGTEYRYGPARVDERGSYHYPLTTIIDTMGNELFLELAGVEGDSQPRRIWAAGNARFLELEYVDHPRATRQRLSKVRVRVNPLAPARLAPDSTAPLAAPLLCVEYKYNTRGLLSLIGRYDGDCAGTPLRAEGFEYAVVSGFSLSRREAAENNLIKYTDPNNVDTEYKYYQPSDTLPGEAGTLTWFDNTEKAERIKAVLEPGIGRTGFTYTLTSTTVPGVTGPVLNVYDTSVTSPRPLVPPTQYKQEGYGFSSNVIRPLRDATAPASSTIEWDPTHLKPRIERDARGRITTYAYDGFGNMTLRAVALPSLAAGPGFEATAAVPRGASVQSWTWDGAFARPTCEVDAEGRATRHQLDSDPLAPGGTGLILRTTRLGTSGGCTGAAPSPDDIVTNYRYCGVLDADGVMPPCTVDANGFKKGDLFETVDAEGNVTRILSYDEHGLPKDVRGPAAGKPSTQIVTTTLRDARGRVTEVSDTRGTVTELKHDGLDRVTCEYKHNTRGPSPGLLTTRTYYPGGQVKTENSGAGTCTSPAPTAHKKSVTLDGRGRPSVVTESGLHLPLPLETTYGYDEAGNRVTVTDGRGVTTTTAFDFADRAISTTVSVTDGALFGANGGDGAGPFTTATISYDSVGNKVAETDVHGFKTEYVLDSLYRVVATKLPAVPGPTLAFASAPYTPARTYDLVGNVLEEKDGNGRPTVRTFDFANRLLSVTDAAGRGETSTWDKNGNLRTQVQAAGGVTHLTRETLYDALNRPILTTETFAGGPTPYTKESAYNDTATGHATATKDARGFVTTTKLDDLGRPWETVVDDDGPSALLTRTPDDARAGSALNLTSHVTFDALGNAALLEDARGALTTSTFDALSRLRARSLPLQVTESWTYTATGAVLTTTDRRGVAREKKYDALGRETKSILVESGGTHLTMLTRTWVDTPSNLLWKVEETDAAGSTTTRFQDALGRTVRVEDAVRPTPNVTQLRYDGRAQRRTKDAKGYVTETDTDAVYRPKALREFDVGATATTPATYSRSTAYDDAARKETSLDWKGTPTVLERDGLGRLTKRTRGSGALLQGDSSVFNAGGQEVLHTDANLHKVEWVYDGAGRKVQETKALGTPDAATWKHTYDAVGNLVATKGPRTTGPGPDVLTTYDGLNRAVRVEDALGHTTFRAYDGAGNLICEKTPNGDAATSYAHGAAPSTLAVVNAAACQATHVTKYEYEEEGKLTKVTTALGSETTYLWDASRKRMLAKQDGNLQLTTYEYDARALRTAEFQHLGAHGRFTGRNNLPGFEQPNLSAHTGTLRWRATWDANGNVETQTDPLGQVATQVHGLRNRLDEVTYSLHYPVPRTLPSVDSESWAYDANGNVEGVTQAKQTARGLEQETTTREYDVLDRLWRETRYDTRQTTYGYDLKGNRTSVTDFQNVATTYTFDAQDRLKTAVTPEGMTTHGYFPDGLLKTTAFFDTVTYEGRCYDDAGRLTALVTARAAVADACPLVSLPGMVSRHDYAHDAEGNRLTQVEELTPAGGAAVGLPELTEYGYDEESRLVGVKYPDQTAALYQLDAVGNRVGERKAASSMVPALTAAAFLAMSPAALTHDVVAVFNRADWLESVTDSRAPAKDATFKWDAAGNLLRQQTASRDRLFTWDVKQTLTKVSDNGIEAGRYDYGADGLRSKRVTALESVEYVLDGMQVLVETDGPRPATTLRSGGTRTAPARWPSPTSQGPTRTTKALHLDALGSPSTETTQTGAVAAVRQYDAWGQYRNGTAPVSTDAKLGYTGHQFDPESGLVYARARYYDPEYGRFLSRDSLEGTFNSAPSLHRFMYARHNPLRYTDPTGHCENRADCMISFNEKQFVSGAISKEQYFHNQAMMAGGAALGVGVVGVAVAPGAAAVGALVNLGADSAVQGARQLDGTQQGFSYAEAGSAFVFGGLAGPVLGPLANAPPAVQAFGVGVFTGVGLAGAKHEADEGHRATALVETAVSLLPAAMTAGPQLRPPSFPKWELPVSNEPLLEMAPVPASASSGPKVVAEGRGTGPSTIVMRVPAQGGAATDEPIKELPDESPKNMGEADAWDQAAKDAMSDPSLAPLPRDPSAQNPLFRPGPYAGDSIPASSPGKATPAEQARLNEIMADTGCHTCGTKNAGTKSGNAVGDHIPPSKLRGATGPRELYPQCIDCSDDQWRAVSDFNRSGGKE